MALCRLQWRLTSQQEREGWVNAGPTLEPTNDDEQPVRSAFHHGAGLASHIGGGQSGAEHRRAAHRYRRGSWRRQAR